MAIYDLTGEYRRYMDSLSNIMTIRRKLVDRIARWLLFSAGISVVVFLGGIFAMLFYYGIQTFADVPLTEFFLRASWNPSAFGDPEYGILTMVVSTIALSFGAMLIAVPVGIGTAAYIAEVAPASVRELLKPIIEILAGIPSVVVGFFGIVFLGPLLAQMFGLSSGLNVMNGSILLAIMALPTIISVSEDAIHSVPDEFKAASLALGANRWKTLILVIIPAAFSGIIASVMLGLGRAIGETMTVLMATGNALEMPGGLFDSVRTMTANIAIELGEVPYGTTHYHSLFAVGLVLFLITLLVNYTAEMITQKLRKHRI